MFRHCVIFSGKKSKIMCVKILAFLDVGSWQKVQFLSQPQIWSATSVNNVYFSIGSITTPSHALTLPQDSLQWRNDWNRLQNLVKNSIPTLNVALCIWLHFSLFPLFCMYSQDQSEPSKRPKDHESLREAENCNNSKAILFTGTNPTISMYFSRMLPIKN